MQVLAQLRQRARAPRPALRQPHLERVVRLVPPAAPLSLRRRRRRPASSVAKLLLLAGRLLIGGRLGAVVRHSPGPIVLYAQLLVGEHLVRLCQPLELLCGRRLVAFDLVRVRLTRLCMVRPPDLRGGRRLLEAEPLVQLTGLGSRCVPPCQPEEHEHCLLGSARTRSDRSGRSLVRVGAAPKVH